MSKNKQPIFYWYKNVKNKYGVIRKLYSVGTEFIFSPVTLSGETKYCSRVYFKAVWVDAGSEYSGWECIEFISKKQYNRKMKKLNK